MLQLSVTLPYYGLSFFVNGREELESRDFEDMVIDENQCIGALIGLENLLVLRPKTHFAGSHVVPEALIPRRILIPNGSPTSHGDHQVRIYANSNINLPGPNEPLFHTYDVDTELGCLTGDGSMTSTRFLAYLHATTTCYRPDPLTDKTGIQAALCLLRSAGCRSIMKLKALVDESNPNANGWNTTRYPQINVAHEEIQDRYYWNRCTREGQVHLATKRAMRRAVHLSPSDVTSTEDHEDMEYSVRESDLELEDAVSAAASAIHCWSSGLTVNAISNWMNMWNSVGTHVDVTPLSPHDGSGIQSNSDLVQTLMGKVHDTLEKEEARRPFQLLFLFPTVAYCSPCHQITFLSMLSTFAMQTHSYSVNLLMIHSDCKISDGPYPKHLTGMHNLAAPGPLALSRRVSPPRYSLNEHTQWQVTLNQLLSNRSAPELPPRNTFSWDARRNNYSPGTPNGTPVLNRLFSSLQPNSAFQQEYLAHLETSAGAHEKYGTSYHVLSKDHIDALQKHYMQCRVNYMVALGTLKRSLGPVTEREQVLEQFGHWPLITADILLQCLACASPAVVPERWKKCMFSLAMLLLELQRARRLLRFALNGLEEEFSKELENEQCDGWNPEEYPDWLLIQVRLVYRVFTSTKVSPWSYQIQGNFLIRRSQAETAMKMISPSSGKNTVMQINMGEGKSSVIIPIVAAALADGKQLVRVVVQKALAVQMFDLLVARLGSLANRPIYHFPFSRSSENDGGYSHPGVDLVYEVMSQCMAEHGILLVQPEHVVSLKLISIEEQIRQGKLADYPFPKLHQSIYKDIMTTFSFRSVRMCDYILMIVDSTDYSFSVSGRCCCR